MTDTCCAPSPFTPAQEARVQELCAATFAQVLDGVNFRLVPVISFPSGRTETMAEGGAAASSAPGGQV